MFNISFLQSISHIKDVANFLVMHIKSKLRRKGDDSKLWYFLTFTNLSNFTGSQDSALSHAQKYALQQYIYSPHKTCRWVFLQIYLSLKFLQNYSPMDKYKEMKLDCRPKIAHKFCWGGRCIICLKVIYLVQRIALSAFRMTRNCMEKWIFWSLDAN